jgi:hypothetical protein
LIESAAAYAYQLERLGVSAELELRRVDHWLERMGSLRAFKKKRLAAAEVLAANLDFRSSRKRSARALVVALAADVARITHKIEVYLQSSRSYCMHVHPPRGSVSVASLTSPRPAAWRIISSFTGSFFRASRGWPRAALCLAKRLPTRDPEQPLSGSSV